MISEKEVANKIRKGVVMNHGEVIFKVKTSKWLVKNGIDPNALLKVYENYFDAEYINYNLIVTEFFQEG